MGPFSGTACGAGKPRASKADGSRCWPSCRVWRRVGARPVAFKVPPRKSGPPSSHRHIGIRLCPRPWGRSSPGRWATHVRFITRTPTSHGRPRPAWAASPAGAGRPSHPAGELLCGSHARGAPSSATAPSAPPLLALAPFTGSQVRPCCGAKREGGARPPRPRHCDRGRNPHVSPLARGAGKGAGSRTIRESGDLPGARALLTGLRGEARAAARDIAPLESPP